MVYKINPPSSGELRQLAYERLGGLPIQDAGALTGDQVKRLLEDLAVNKIEVEIQNEYLQDTWAKLESALSEARDLYDFAPIGCFSTDTAGRIIKLNLTGATMLGLERNLLMGRCFVDFFSPEESADVKMRLQLATSSGEDQRCELTVNAPGALTRYVQLTLSPLAWGQGHHLVLTDITDYRALAHELRSNEERWKFALDAAGDGVWDWDVQTGIVTYSAKLGQLYGLAQDQFSGTMEAWRERVHPDDAPGLVAAIQKCLSGTEERFSHEHRRLGKDGHWMWVRSQGAVFGRDAEGHVARVVGTHSDITRQKQLEYALLETSGIQQAIIDSLPHYIAVLDADGNILQTNAVWNALALANGRSYGDSVFQQGYGELLDAVTGGVQETKRVLMAGIGDVLSGRMASFTHEYSFLSGLEMRWFLMSALTVSNGRARVVVTHQDVTHIKKSPATNFQVANFDELTHTLSRRNFLQVAEREFARAQRYGLPLMALVIDVDQLKAINGRFGNAAGDAVLHGFAEVARQVLRGSDVIGRIGGDEFAVLLPDTSLDGGQALALRLAAVVAENPVEVAGQSVAYAVSIGGSCLQKEASFAQLLQRADAALLQSRAAVGSRVLIDTSGSPCLW